MAHPIRCAKSGCAWTANELLAYNIEIRSQSAETFFGHPLPTLDGIDPLLVSGTIGTDGITVRYTGCYDVFRRHQQRIPLSISSERLRQLDYEERGTLLMYHYPIPLAEDNPLSADEFPKHR